MDKKKIRKSIGRFFGWIALMSCYWTLKIVPMRYTYAFAKGVSSLGYKLAVKHRRVALDNLSLAFGQDKPKQELEQIAKQCFEFMAKGGMELLLFLESPQKLKDNVKIINQQYFDQALSRGKGVILVSAHFGNFPLLLARLSVEGYNVGVLLRVMRDRRVEKFFADRRKLLKMRTIHSQPRNVCVSNTIEALRNNEAVFLPLDQNFGSAGVYVDFFGKKAATATGPVIFARRTKAAIVPCFIIRQKDDTHQIVFEPPIELEEGKDKNDTITINIQKLTNIIESYIRRYPAEWGWIHRRWKSRPS
ncbi:MAG: lysophospholipid acyltransferase family protein [Candidatus Omnitrophota bacterium]